MVYNIGMILNTEWYSFNTLGKDVRLGRNKFLTF